MLLGVSCEGSKISSSGAAAFHRSRLTMSGVVLSMGGGGGEDEEDVANLLQGDDYDGDGYDYIWAFH